MNQTFTATGKLCAVTLSQTVFNTKTKFSVIKSFLQFHRTDLKLKILKNRANIAKYETYKSRHLSVLCNESNLDLQIYITL